MSLGQPDSEERYSIMTGSTPARPVALEQEGQRHHQDGGKRQHIINIDIGQGLRLRLKLAVQLRLRQMQSICFACGQSKMPRNPSICC